MTKVYLREELQHWVIRMKHDDLGLLEPDSAHPVMCVHGYISWHECQIQECQAHFLAKIRQWWVRYRRPLRRDRGEFVVRPVMVSRNKPWAFITGCDYCKIREELEDRRRTAGAS